MKNIQTINNDEIEMISGGWIVPVLRAVYAAATSKTGKAIFAGAAVMAAAAASDVFGSDEN
jgi:hypothetical protein